VEDELYGASAGELLARFQRISDDVATVLLIGHNPAVHELAVLLAADPGRIPSFPTAALAELRVPIRRWEDLHPGVATLHTFLTPKTLD
jgi:phosphohistidine phosphatase